MKRRIFLKSMAGLAGSGLLPLEAFAQADRRKEILIVANETGPNSLESTPWARTGRATACPGSATTA